MTQNFIQSMKRDKRRSYPNEPRKPEGDVPNFQSGSRGLGRLDSSGDAMLDS
jgi:hypothetical protein